MQISRLAVSFLCTSCHSEGWDLDLDESWSSFLWGNASVFSTTIAISQQSRAVGLSEPAQVRSEMKFSEIAALLTVLCLSFGEVKDCDGTAFQEECAGAGNLTAGVRLFHLASARRDVSCLPAVRFVRV